MLVYNEKRALQPLLAPQFGVPGPYSIGQIVPIRLSIRSVRSADAKNLRVRFVGEGVRIVPEEIEIDFLAGYEHQDIEANAEILPAERNSRVKVWAELHGAAEHVLQTAPAIASIQALARLRLDIDGDELIIANDGDKQTTVTLQALPVVPAIGDLALDWNGVSPAFQLDAHAERRVTLGDFTGTLTLSSPDGERAVTRRTSTAINRPSIEATLAISVPPKGARYGDLLPFEVQIANMGTAAAQKLAVNLPLPPGIEIQRDLLSIDDVRMVPSDYDITQERVTLRLGRLGEQQTAYVRGAFVLTADRRSEHDVIDMDGFVNAKDVDPERIRHGIQIDRTPLFVSHTSYLGEIEPSGENLLGVPTVVTNAEPLDIERVKVRYEVSQARIKRVVDEHGRQMPLHPSNVGGRPTTLVSLDTLRANERRIIIVQLQPNPTGSEEHNVAIRATLLADGYHIDLGTRERVIAGQVVLKNSKIEFMNGIQELRLGTPVDLRLTISNEGTVPASDVRIAIPVPDQVAVHLPREAEGRWYPLVAQIPPGGSASLPMQISLHAPLNAESLDLQPEIDASNATAVRLQPLTVPTPAQALLDVSDPFVEAQGKGLVAVGIRITNIGDGEAHDIILTVPETDCVVGRTTHVDGEYYDEDGNTPIVVRGLKLGSLPAGAYREVSWLVTPAPGEYVAHVNVRAEDADINVKSRPISGHLRTGFAVQLPSPRRIDDDASPRPDVRPQAPTIEPENALEDSGDVRALGAGKATADTFESPVHDRTEQPPNEEGRSLLDGLDEHEPTATIDAPKVEAAQQVQEPAAPPAPEPAKAEAMEPAQEPTLTTQAPPAESVTSLGNDNAAATAPQATEQGGTLQQQTVVEPKAATGAFTPAWDSEDDLLSTQQPVIETPAPHAPTPPVEEPVSFFGPHPSPENDQREPQSGNQPERVVSMAASNSTTELVEKDAQQFLEIAALLNDAKGLQGWVHAIALRLAVPTKFASARESVESYIERILPSLLNEDTTPTRAFINAAISYDTILMQDLAAEQEDAGDTEARLDAALSRLAADRLLGATPQTQKAYTEYRDLLIEHFQIDLFQNRDNEDRRVNLSVDAIVALDEALDALVRVSQLAAA